MSLFLRPVRSEYIVSVRNVERRRESGEHRAEKGRGKAVYLGILACPWSGDIQHVDAIAVQPANRGGGRTFHRML